MKAVFVGVAVLSLGLRIPVLLGAEKSSSLVTAEGKRAAEEITRVLGHSTEAQEYRRLFDAGSRWTDANLGRTLAFSDDIVVAPGKDLTILL